MTKRNTDSRESALTNSSEVGPTIRAYLHLLVFLSSVAKSEICAAADDVERLPYEKRLNHRDTESAEDEKTGKQLRLVLDVSLLRRDILGVLCVSVVRLIAGKVATVPAAVPGCALVDQTAGLYSFAPLRDTFFVG
jgi:hypothetical protein